jgi:hypothetical protein
MDEKGKDKAKACVEEEEEDDEGMGLEGMEFGREEEDV